MTINNLNSLFLLIPGLFTGLSLIFVALTLRHLVKRQAVVSAVIIDKSIKKNR